MFFALLSVAFVACEKEPSEAVKPVIKVTTGNVVEFTAQGGSQEIAFQVSNAVDSERVKISEVADWISVVTDTTSADITVEANMGAAREAQLILSYANADKVTVTVKQAGRSSDEKVEFKAQYLNGNYYGKSGSAYNYYVILSDKGVTSKLETKPGGTYYYFDFYSEIEGDENGAVLPDGTYTFDASNSYAAGTLTDEGSWFALMDSKNDYAAAWNIESATVVVDGNTFDAVITFKGGETHHVTYEGSMLLAAPLSTLTADYSFTLAGATIKAMNCGDSYEVGKTNWFVEVTKDTQNGDMVMLDLLADSADNCNGLYSVLSNATDYSYKFLPGVIGADGLACSWYAKFNSGKLGSTIAPLAGGIIKIEQAGSGNAKITLSCTDDTGNKIEATIDGSIEVVDMQ